jgi:hypothetical protein
MASFESQIISLTGISSNATNQGYMTDWLTNAARDVINSLPPQALINMGSITELDDSPTTLVNVDRYIILGVSRVYNKKATTSQIGRLRACRQISWSDIGIAESDSGYVQSYSVEDPVYYIYNNTLYVEPVSDATYSAIVHHVEFPGVADEDTSIADFPKGLEQAVIYRAAADAARFLFQDEQDEDVYVPLIKDLTNQFANSLKIYLSQFQAAAPVQQEEVASGGSLQKMLKKLGGG